MDPKRVAMISGVSRLDDASFLFSAWNGLKSAREELGLETSIIEARLEDDPSEEIAYLAEQGYQVVWAVGFITSEVVTKCAANYPDVTFIVVDASQEESGLPSNVLRILFREDEGAFLAGVAAARASRTGHVGFVGGLEIPVIRRFAGGFEDGVERAGGVELHSVFTDSFVSYAAGRRAALKLIGERCDVIFHAAGAAGKGVIREVSEAGLKAIGCDIDQSFLAPATVIASVVKRLDRVVPSLMSEWLVGRVAPGVERSYGIAEEAIDLTPVANVPGSSQIEQEISQLRKELLQRND